MKKYFVYILRCRNKSLYVGFTGNLKKRILDHKSGNGSLFTKNKLPVKLVYYEFCSGFNIAKQRENQIKKWRREKKENLIRFGRPYV